MSNRKDYQDLIKRVARIDKNAAQYMRRRAKKLKSFSPCFSLSGCFVFKETPQGIDYWWSIYDEL